MVTKSNTITLIVPPGVTAEDRRVRAYAYRLFRQKTGERGKLSLLINTITPAEPFCWPKPPTVHF